MHDRRRTSEAPDAGGAQKQSPAARSNPCTAPAGSRSWLARCCHQAVPVLIRYPRNPIHPAKATIPQITRTTPRRRCFRIRTTATTAKTGASRPPISPETRVATAYRLIG
ncbi:hypothetical protein [Amycolatopsis sp. cg9]|uniref:hypothetical protein n=1 Tax=Amycolatopsis sp. cg9 TaxID=3238801 RepID=UPI003524EFB4